jgi:hypothetical protein
MLSSIIVVFFLLISFGISHAFNLNVWFDNRISQYQYYKKYDGYFFILDLTPNGTDLDNIEYATAVNTNPELFGDYRTYDFEIIFLGNNILEIASQNEYNGQGGIYEATVHFKSGSAGTATSGYIEPRTDPIPNPQNLKVDFSKGYRNPTMSFSSVEDETVDTYELSLYKEPFRQERLARYRTNDPDSESFTYYPGAPGGTGKPLEVGTVYIFRAEAYDVNTGGDSFYRSFNYLAFLVPDPTIHYTCEYLRTLVNQSDISRGIKQSLLAKLKRCDDNRLNAFINHVSALRGKKIHRWLADILIQCANGVLSQGENNEDGLTT